MRAVVHATIADANAGDLAAFLARFEPGAAVVGVPSSDADVVYSALLAGGAVHEVSSCVPDGVAARGLGVACDIVISHPSAASSGVRIDGRVSLVVDEFDTIVSTSLTPDRGVFDDFDMAFAEWLADAHPDVHAGITWVGDDAVPAAADQPFVAEYYAEFAAQSDEYPVDG